MSEIHIYDAGDRIKMFGLFTPGDPTVVKFELYNNRVYVGTYIYGIDLDVTRLGVGSYCFEFVIPVAGYWTYILIGTGIVQAVETWFFIARH